MTDQRFVSYAQNMEDVMLWRALHHAAGASGCYIDVGAADPTALSVTRAFYDRGWHGVNVEPLPEQADRLRQARPRDVVVQAALVEAEGPPRPFHRVIQDRQTGLSTTDLAEADHHRQGGAVVETIDVPVMTLASLCATHVQGVVHFLKIDVEGAEAAVLAGADFHAVRPWIVLVEATQPLDAASADLRWEQPLLGAGYRQVWFDGLNRYYLAEEHADLEPHFQVPPNVFDNFTVFDPDLQEHLAATTALAQRRLERIEQLEHELAEQDRRPQMANDAATPDAAAATPANPVLDQPAAPPSVPIDAQRMIELPFIRTGVGRRVGTVLYRLLRPIVRPLAWRGRQFVTGEIRQEMADLRIRLDQLVARPVAEPTTTGRMTSPGVMDAMERMLLTLALEDGRRDVLPLLKPAPELTNDVRRDLEARDFPKAGAAR